MARHVFTRTVLVVVVIALAASAVIARGKEIRKRTTKDVTMTVVAPGLSSEAFAQTAANYWR